MDTDTVSFAPVYNNQGTAARTRLNRRDNSWPRRLMARAAIGAQSTGKRLGRWLNEGLNGMLEWGASSPWRLCRSRYMTDRDLSYLEKKDKILIISSRKS